VELQRFSSLFHREPQVPHLAIMPTLITYRHRIASTRRINTMPRRLSDFGVVREIIQGPVLRSVARGHCCGRSSPTARRIAKIIH
jgi:hypothetical protein